MKSNKNEDRNDYNNDKKNNSAENHYMDSDEEHDYRNKIINNKFPPNDNNDD